MSIELVDIYSRPPTEWWVPLYLLDEREPHENISHRKMPTLPEHEAFVRSRPYPHWYLIDTENGYAGAVYLTDRDEIGIGILRAHRRAGLAGQSIAALMQRAQRPRYFANINPANEASIALFRMLGFGGPIQVTYARDA